MPSRRDNRVSIRGRNNSQQAEDLKGMRGKELEGLGYMYEEISHIDLVQDEVNWVLTAVVQEIELQDFEIGESGDSYPHSHFIEKALSLLVERAFVLLREQLEMLFSDAFRSRTRTTMSKTLLHGLLLLHSPATGYSVVSPANFQRVMTALLESIKDSPHVAEKVCGIIYFFSQGCEGFEAGSSVLTPFIADIVTSLIATAERTYASDTKLSSDKRSRFRSFHQMIEKNKEISKLCSRVFSKFLIRNLAVLVKRSLLFSRLPTRLCCCFLKYSLVVAQQFMKKQCLDDKMLPYCDNIMTLLLKDLSSGDLHRSVKPLVFSCFGDVALAIGENFEKYVPYAMPMMQGAAEVCAQIDVNEEEMVEYGSQLKRSISKAYSGNLQGFKNSKAELMLPHAPHLVKFMELAIKDTQRKRAMIDDTVNEIGGDGDIAHFGIGNAKRMPGKFLIWICNIR
ncbi:importin subunit beta-1 [Tanacetum coccineum]